MGALDRMELAQTAAKEVLKTLRCRVARTHTIITHTINTIHVFSTRAHLDNNNINRQSDYATIVAFSTTATSASTNMMPMTAANKATLNTYIDNLGPGGSTNFEAAFNKAFSVLQSSRDNNARSGCFASVVLFLTDGEITVGLEDEDVSPLTHSTIV